MRAFSILEGHRPANYLRLRHAAKKANRDCSVTVLDKAGAGRTARSDDDASALDELVALAGRSASFCEPRRRPQRGRRDPMESARSVAVYSSGFEDWLRAAYWRAKEMGVPETTMKSALATLAAAGINDGDEIESTSAPPVDDDGYLIDLADEQWQAITSPQGWRW